MKFVTHLTLRILCRVSVSRTTFPAHSQCDVPAQLSPSKSQVFHVVSEGAWGQHEVRVEGSICFHLVRSRIPDCVCQIHVCMGTWDNIMQPRGPVCFAWSLCVASQNKLSQHMRTTRSIQGLDFDAEDLHSNPCRSAFVSGPAIGCPPAGEPRFVAPSQDGGPQRKIVRSGNGIGRRRGGNEKASRCCRRGLFGKPEKCRGLDAARQITLFCFFFLFYGIIPSNTSELLTRSESGVEFSFVVPDGENSTPSECRNDNHKGRTFCLTKGLQRTH